jgi:hypothetical protein
MGPSARRAARRRSLCAARRWDAALPARGSTVAVRDTSRERLYAATGVCGPRCRLSRLSPTLRLPRADRQRHARPAGERRSAPAYHCGRPASPSVGGRSGYPLERCRGTPVATCVDGALASANGDGGLLARELVSTRPTSAGGPLPPAPELAGAPGTQCTEPSSRDEYPGLGRDAAGPRTPPAPRVRPTEALMCSWRTS